MTEEKPRVIKHHGKWKAYLGEREVPCQSYEHALWVVGMWYRYKHDFQYRVG
jgi:hypothetical protein